MSTTTTGTYTREDTTFDSHGTSCAAWLYRPDRGEAPPIIVMAHGFGAVRGMRLDAYAERFAQAGFAVLVFDYRGFGDSDGRPRQVLSVPMQHEDWRAAVAHARTLPDVDTSRVVAWGTSFAGGHVLHLAAEDHDLAAVIAQVPHVSGPAAVRSVPVRVSARLILAGLRDAIGAALGRSPHRVPAVGKPGEIAMMTAPDAWPLVQRLVAADLPRFERENVVAARIALVMATYSPGRHADRITAPTLVQIALKDIVTPVKVAKKAAARIPRAQVKTYDCSHFEPYLDPYFESVVGDQIDFLNRTLG
ncbi:alpha/beta hydrolase [Patulibacter sp.]|uniref:alpha/beta hydrolase n=1 Tax=Patulibacter sp. TaxID=1912859 RepID=UPI00271FF742|nr:alpha/beta hydrolase [Patulibacter sp.]MDO9406962.1 alpha/beta hydrolase [Patulibacter sp.]